MIPLRVLIADDEPPARLRLKALLSDIAGDLPNLVVGEADSGQKAWELLSRPDCAADVILLDIRMPGMDGLMLAERLRALPRPPAVIFTTACDDHALRAFDLDAVDYLLKPIRAERLLAALEKARRTAPPGAAADPGRRHLPVTERGRSLLLPVADILYLRADQKYVSARTADREWLLDESLAHLEEEYPRRFLRIHRNCLVAREAVAGWERDADDGDEPRWRLLLHGVAETLPVSRRQWPVVKAVLEDGK
ncbi:MAG: LytTR family DNA-binding domain-containing protein [Rhodocyclaceae bacterium]|nr:LytTR family DNA-binding domain-containing protein [Rhodocyclaceae bacterium]